MRASDDPAVADAREYPRDARSAVLSRRAVCPLADQSSASARRSTTPSLPDGKPVTLPVM